MRVSTGMIFDAGVASINRQTASLLNVQQQVASGRRILRPSDDPVAAARALEVTQASDVVAQFKRNQDVATSALGQMCIRDSVRASANLADIINALNTLGANPQDLTAILQAMKSAGALRAELEII